MRIEKLIFIAGILFANISPAQNKRPNFILILTDDQGYGDISINGNPTIKTPNIDRLALEGQKWSNFYVAANVCTPQEPD